MATFYELALLSQAVYAEDPTPTGWVRLDRAAPGSYGFQAAAYRSGGETVLAFRGTTASAGDLAADLKLGVGMNTSHFGQAGDFIQDYLTAGDLTLCGHSLGGAIAQTVGNRAKVKFATFNAPGVGVLNSREIITANPGMTAIRLAGAVAGTIFHPVQTAQDIASTFYAVQGVNVCLENDLVSQIGLHYGKVVRIPGTGLSPLSQHSIATVVDVLAASPLRNLRISDYF